MRKSELCLQAKKKYAKGINVIGWARAELDVNLEAAIEVSYDLQSGSYTSFANDSENRKQLTEWGSQLGGILEELDARTVCEAGVGEATTLKFVMSRSRPTTRFSGFDISLSRLLWARDFLLSEADLFVADLGRIPLPDNSVDAVITNHGIEPNGGREAEILQELHRVCARHLVLVEPDFENVPEKQKTRMIEHNYVQNLPAHLAKLPGRILRHEPWPLIRNPLNRASLIIFEKSSRGRAPSDLRFVSPVTKQDMVHLENSLYCEAEGLLYPILFSIPVLRDECAIICSHAMRSGAVDRKPAP